MKSTARRIEEDGRSGARQGHRRVEAHRSEKLIAAAGGMVSHGNALSEPEAEHGAEIDADIPVAVDALVDEYRARCLWFLRADYYPTSRAARIRTLDSIMRHGDLEAHRRAGVLKRWLLQSSSEGFAS